MLARIFSSGVVGIDGFLVEVEVDLERGLPGFSVVGLAEGAVKESKERVSAAIRNTGFRLPMKKITVNLAPADIKKEGSFYDLPIAIGILASSGEIPLSVLDKFVIAGELSLEGKLRKIRGVLPIASMTQKKNFTGIIVPLKNGMEAALMMNGKTYAFSHLRDVVSFLKGGGNFEPVSFDFDSYMVKSRIYDFDFADIKGQSQAKRAVEIAASGGHNIIMIGPPGSGKTMLARSFPTILPEMNIEEALETTRIHSVVGFLKDHTPLLLERPFRSPHHTISDAGLIGGTHNPKPGEISLAHNGVLFLDELPEFRRNVLESLRQPLEDGFVTISRAKTSVTFPSRFMLVGAMNPCPCGYYGDPVHECKCTVSEIRRYRNKISGPLLDRIDIFIEVPNVTYFEISDKRKGESSQIIRERVKKVREIQRKRFETIEKKQKMYVNAQMGPKEVEQFCILDDNAQELLKKAQESFGISARGYHRVLKVSRTIADMDQSEIIRAEHLAEALQYRSFDEDIE